MNNFRLKIDMLIKMFFGAHESISGGVLKALERTKKLGGNSLQIFLRSPRSRNGIKIKDDDVEKSNIFMKENGIKMVVHSSYLLNFSKEIEDNLWAINIIIDDLKFSERLNAIGCIIHMGKCLNLTLENAIDNFCKSINHICENYNGKSKLILENSARQGTEFGYSMSQISLIYSKIKHKEKIGFCIDTCHAFSAGYNFKSPNQIKLFFEYFEQNIGFNKLLTIHFNDSKKELGCCVDRHENLCKGAIGVEKDIGFHYLINELNRRKFNYPIILETPDGGDNIRGSEIIMLKKWLFQKINIISNSDNKLYLVCKKK